MEKSNAVKNKFKFIAILVLVLAIIAGTIGVIYNYKNKKILARITDIEGKIAQQDVLLNVNKNEDGTYSLKLPETVNSFMVKGFYKDDTENLSNSSEESESDTEGQEENFLDKTVILTKDELKKREINLQAKYDTEEASKTQEDGEETKVTLYNRKLEYNDGELTIEGYMPLNSELQVRQEEITEEEKIEDKSNLQKLSISVYEKVEKIEEVEEAEEINETEETNETEKTEEVKETEKIEETREVEKTQGEIEFLEYDPSDYLQELTIKTNKNKSILQRVRTTLEDNNYVNLEEVSFNDTNKTILLEEKVIEDAQQVGKAANFVARYTIFYHGRTKYLLYLLSI